LIEELGGGGRFAPAGSTAEFGEALGNPPPLFRPMGFIPDQDETKNLPMLCFRGASVLGRPYAQAADNIVIEVANR